MKKDSKIYVAGHRGLVGSAIMRKLKDEGYINIITATHNEVDLTNQVETDLFVSKNTPDYVFLCAAKVGGIGANSTYPADFTYENLMVQTNVINSCHKYNVKKLLFLGSSCIYPRNCEQPIKEEYLLSGPLEKSNDGYAIAKIAGIILCQKYNQQYNTNYISLMPTNLYGPNDNYNLENSHVFPALIRKFHEAKERNDDKIVLWGTGKPFREFLHVDDLAKAAIFLMDNYDDGEIINIGTGIDISIRELAYEMKSVIDFKGDIVFDDTKLDGTPRKLLDVSKIHKLGWTHSIDLKEGIEKTYKDFLQNYDILK